MNHLVFVVAAGQLTRAGIVSHKHTRKSHLLDCFLQEDWSKRKRVNRSTDFRSFLSVLLILGLSCSCSASSFVSGFLCILLRIIIRLF